MTGSRELVWATSWGVSTRLIGAMVMSHSDDKGMYLHTCLQMFMYRCMYKCMFVCKCVRTYEYVLYVYVLSIFLQSLFFFKFLLALLHFILLFSSNYNKLIDSMNRSSSSSSGSPRSSGHCPDH